jgi:hypothetical protein
MLPPIDNLNTTFLTDTLHLSHHGPEKEKPRKKPKPPTPTPTPRRVVVVVVVAEV